VSARIRAGSKFKKFLCLVSIDVTYLLIPQVEGHPFSWTLLPSSSPQKELLLMKVLLIYPEDRGSNFLRNIGTYLTKPRGCEAVIGVGRGTNRGYRGHGESKAVKL
jgi:hypothetical protein